MQLLINKDRFLELMADFYLLTGIRMVLFDSQYQEILAYPEKRCDFCELMHGHPMTQARCQQSDQRSFAQCTADKDLVLYTCHAGLIEATAPLVSGGRIIGYIMMGQVSTEENFPNTQTKVRSNIPLELFDKTQLFQSLFSIQRKADESIRAASRILKVCTYYVLNENLVQYQKNSFLRQLSSYIDENLNQPLTPEELGAHLGMSRSKLYQLAQKHLGMGIARYIKQRRLQAAQELLEQTELTVTQVAEQVGFSDYNYFCRCYRQEFGESATQQNRLSEEVEILQ